MMLLAFASLIAFTNVVGNVGMLVGAVVWLVFELWGVFTGSKTQRDTTSAWVWALEARFPIARWFVGVFVLSLFGHFVFGTWLLP